MKKPATRKKLGLLLQAEVVSKGQPAFEKRYLAATGTSVTPGTPVHYQDQPNKWGSELRVYFNNAGLAATLSASGQHVETRRNGYLAGKYKYRVNNNKLWWHLVEKGGLKLGSN